MKFISKRAFTEEANARSKYLTQSGKVGFCAIAQGESYLFAINLFSFDNDIGFYVKIYLSYVCGNVVKCECANVRSTKLFSRDCLDGSV